MASTGVWDVGFTWGRDGISLCSPLGSARSGREMGSVAENSPVVLLWGSCIPKNPLRTFPAVPLFVNPPRKGRIGGCPARSTVRTGNLSSWGIRGLFPQPAQPLGLGRHSWAWGKGLLRKRKKGRGRFSITSHIPNLQLSLEASAVHRKGLFPYYSKPLNAPRFPFLPAQKGPQQPLHVKFGMKDNTEPTQTPDPKPDPALIAISTP